MSLQSAFYPSPIVEGTTAGTFAAGNDSRITGAAKRSETPTFRSFVEECNAKLSEYAINPELEVSSTWLYSTSAAPFNYNENCWLPPSAFDFSGVSLHQRNGALVTKRHVLFAGHYCPAVGETVSFLRPDNTVASSTVQKIIPFGRRQGTYKVVGVSGNKLQLDGIVSYAEWVMVRKNGLFQTVQCFALNELGGYTGTENQSNEIELYNFELTGGEPAPPPFTQFTSLDSSYIGANVITGRSLADFRLIQLSSEVSGCAVYPLLNSEFYQQPESPPVSTGSSEFGEDTDMTIYGVICPQNTRRQVIAKKFKIVSYPFSNNMGVSVNGYTYESKLIFKRVDSFNINIGGIDFAGGGSGLGSEGIIGGDSGSPMFVIDKNNQLILAGLVQTAGNGDIVGPSIEGLREVLTYAAGIGGYNRPWWQGSSVYQPYIATEPEVVEHLPFRFLYSYNITDFDSRARESAREVAKGVRSPNLISNQGALVSINAGTGAPSATAPNGSIYLRTDGDASTTIYVMAGDAWTPLVSS